MPTQVRYINLMACTYLPKCVCNIGGLVTQYCVPYLYQCDQLFKTVQANT